MSAFHTLTIKDITRETPKAVSIEFEVPQDLKNDYSFISGQYITIKTQIKNNEIRRAYSLCTAPDSGSLRVAVKEIEGGTFSVYANQTLSVGDILDVHTPEGNFLLESNPTAVNTYAAFVGGSGITPVMSMIKTVMSQEPNSRFVLVYGNQTPDQTIFLQELTALQEAYSDRLFIEFFYSRTDEEGARFGRIEKSTVNYILKNKFKDTTFKRFYSCGPEEMIHTVTDVLLENDISKDDIHFELFTSSKETEIDANLDGKTTITVLVDDEETTFVMDQKKTILDASIAEDVDAPYSCQGGICSSCICKITDGTAIMENNGILTDEEIAKGLVLACQAHPTSATIKIDFDDV